MTYLEHVAKNAEHAVEAGVLGIATFGGVSLPLNARHDLSDEDQIDDQRGSKERVLADVEQADGLVAIQEDLGIVLVKSALVVSNSRHVLDDDAVVWVLAFLVKHSVSGDHVVNDVGLGDLLGAELLLGAEVHAVVVAKMVVAGNGGELDTGVDQEVDQGRLHLGLSGLEVITTDECIVLLSELNGTGNECVLRRAVNEDDALEDARNGKDGRRSNFLVTCFDGLEEIVGSVIDAFNKVGESLGVCRPLNDDLVKAVCSFEVTEIVRERIPDTKYLDRQPTECPCGSVQHEPCKPWCPRGRYRHALLDWRR